MTADERIQILLEQGEELGCLNLSAVSEFLQEAELDEEQVTGFFEQLDERGVPLTDDCARPDAVEGTYVNGDLAAATTDALQLFLNEAGRYKLLTAPEEVELAKRIERPPTDEEVADKAKLSLKHVKEVRAAARAVTSLDKPVGEEGATSFGDLIAGESAEPAEEVHVSLAERAVRNAVEGLPEREREVVKLRYGMNGDRDPQSLEEIGRTS